MKALVRTKKFIETFRLPSPQKTISPDFWIILSCFDHSQDPFHEFRGPLDSNRYSFGSRAVRIPLRGIASDMICVLPDGQWISTELAAAISPNPKYNGITLCAR